MNRVCRNSPFVTSSATILARPAWSWTIKHRSSPMRNPHLTVVHRTRLCSARPRHRNDIGTPTRSGMKRVGCITTGTPFFYEDITSNRVGIEIGVRVFRRAQQDVKDRRHMTAYRCTQCRIGE